ncbi:MAG: hypothetical protein ACYSWP_07365 [Planctomycetota bacterium]|jgi:hypothetical protein
MKRLRYTKPTWLFFFIICLAAMVILAASFNLVARRKKFNTQRDIAAEAATQRQWAAALETPGVKNFHKVSDQLYRGAQPTAEGMVKLKNMGVKTIVSLRPRTKRWFAFLRLPPIRTTYRFLSTANAEPTGPEQW